LTKDIICGLILVMDRDRVEYWPAHLQSVFAVIGKRMGDKKLVPTMLNSMPETRGAIVAGHGVTIAHAPGKRAGPRSGHYVVTIVGPRINACWKFSFRELETLSRSVADAVTRKCETRDGSFELGAEVWITDMVRE